jgi:hypothetical protein
VADEHATGEYANGEHAAVDPFEAELRSFRPAAPSRALSDRIGRELAAGTRSIRPWQWFAGTAAAVAASLVVGVAAWRVTHPYGGNEIRPTPPMAMTTHPVPSVPNAAEDDDRPSLASYRRALSRSPGAVDELLDRHAARLLPRDRDDSPATARLGVSAGFEMLR